MKEGKMITCIDDSGMKDRLTYMKIYEVIDERVEIATFKTLFTIIDDEGKAREYEACRFTGELPTGDR